MMSASVLKNSWKFLLLGIIILTLVPSIQAYDTGVVNKPVYVSFTHINTSTGLPFVGYASELLRWNGISWETSPVVGNNITNAEGRDHFSITETIAGTYLYRVHLPAVDNSWTQTITIKILPLAGTRVTGCSVIGSPGYYLLGNSISSVDNSSCIIIKSQDVVFDGMGYTIQGSTKDDSSMANGIHVSPPPDKENLTNVSVRNVTLMNWSHGIVFSHSEGKISHAKAYGNFIDGIWVEKSGNIIIENTTANDGIFRGIGIKDSKNILVINNTATGNLGKDSTGGLGLRIDNATQITVKDNDFVWNKGVGVVILNASHIIVEGNTMNHNNGNGMVLVTSTMNTITHNRIANNGNSGISIQSSGQNSFSDNFLNNTNNVQSDSPNIWNITRKTGINIMRGPNLGGNYWAKPDGTGFSQTCTDLTHDVICDAAYSINAGTIDYLPLSSFAVLPLPGYTNPPTDPDNDGIYEDLNGNTRLDFADVVLYFNQMEWIAAHEPVSSFDLNSNGRIDFADIVRLFGEI